MLRSLVDFEVYPDNAVNDNGDLVDFTLLVEVEPICYEELVKHELFKIVRGTTFNWEKSNLDVDWFAIK